MTGDWVRSTIRSDLIVDRRMVDLLKSGGEAQAVTEPVVPIVTDSRRKMDI